MRATRPQSLRPPSIHLGRALTRAAEWVEDEVARLRHEGSASGEGPRVTTHTALAGALGAVAVIADVAAGPAFGPIVAIASQAAMCGLATHAAIRVARRRGITGERARPILSEGIAHAEREQLCTPYMAEAWRIVCRVDGWGDHGARRRAAARMFVRAGAGAAMLAAATRLEGRV
jgi:hypothetical protein